MSSNILAAQYRVEDFGLIYAGAQKNIGPAGVTVVIIREDLLDDEPVLSSMLDYRIQADNGSLYNTPPTFAIYMAKLVFEWVKELGGVAEMEKRNREKSGLLYDFIEQSDFYRSPVRYKEQRSVAKYSPLCLLAQSWMPSLTKRLQQRDSRISRGTAA